jgi:hypothetical protein
MKKVVIGIIIGLAIGLVIGFVAPSIMPPTQTPDTSETYIYIDGKIVVGGDGEPIELINNPNATNPTYAELLAFLEADQTDKYSYIVGPPKVAYVCADFARDVHNNAEAAGIRAAWVGIDIEGEAEGHALNAFQTTDMGLVYIDCTGKGLWDDPVGHTRWDRRAYVEEGQAYQVAYIERAQTRFKFMACEPYLADTKTLYGQRFVTDEQLLGRLEELGWIRFEPWLATVEQREQKIREMLVWSRTHHIEELGLQWIQEWIREHEVELYGRDFEPHEISRTTAHYLRDTTTEVGGAISQLDTISYVTDITWYIVGDWLDTSWFQPIERLIDVDGIPIFWRVDWEMMPGTWYSPFSNEVVEAIHIYWGE